MRDCIRYNKRGNEMKKLLLISFLLVSVFNLHGQEWVSDKTYEEKIHEKSAFGDDEISITYKCHNCNNKVEIILNKKQIIKAGVLSI